MPIVFLNMMYTCICSFLRNRRLCFQDIYNVCLPFFVIKKPSLFYEERFAHKFCLFI